MRELLGRLTSLDPDAGESLNVIAYFDALVDGLAGLEAFVRGAAALTGRPAGVLHRDHGILMRCLPTGHREDPADQVGDPSKGWPRQLLGPDPGAAVWLERQGPTALIDDMVLERFAAGVRVTVERTHRFRWPDDRAAVEILLDPMATADARRRAAWRLELGEHDQLRALAGPPGGRNLRLPPRSSVIISAVGPVRAEISTGSGDDAPASSYTHPARGIGPAGGLLQLPQSWACAVTALRLTSTVRPVVRYEHLGGIAVLADATDSQPGPHPDVRGIEVAVAANGWALDTLHAAAITDSVRACADLLRIHHSTLQHRIPVLETALGYGISSAPGRTRLAVGLALYGLTHALFDYDDETRRPTGNSTPGPGRSSPTLALVHH